MARFTRTLMSILQEHAGDNDITTIDGIYDVASDVLFPADGLELISPEYQKRLVVGFTLHYFRDEIGLETLPLWKLALLEKLVNNDEYINEIYANLDKQIFDNYRVRNVASTGETSGVKNATGSSNSTKNVIGSDNGSNERTYADGTLGTKTTEDIGNETSSLEKKGAELHKRGGNDDLEKKGAEFTRNSGTDTTTDDGYNNNVNSKGTSTYNNGVNYQLDTPMDSLDDMRTPGGPISAIVEYDTIPPVEPPVEDPGSTYGRDLTVYAVKAEQGSDQKGAGFDYILNQSYDYLAGATEQDSTQYNVENGNDNTYNYNKSATDHGMASTTVYGRQAEYPEGVTEPPAEDKRIDTTTYNSHDVTIYGTDGEDHSQEQDPPALNRIDETTRDTTHTVTDSSNESKTGSESSTNLNEHTVNDVTDNTSASDEMTTGTHEDNTDEVDYNISMKLVLESESFLRKLWDIFDDLFMTFTY